jgi:membrane protein YqaA with SNARE-associated domain
LTMFNHILDWLFPLGSLGLLLIALADSSFLFIPVGCDLLLILLVARGHPAYLVYVLAATFGSALGVLLLDIACRRIGEKGLAKLVSTRRLQLIKKKLRDRSGLMLAAASLAPPPFPFTGCVAASSLAKYPRKKLLSVVFIGRLARYSLIAWAGIHYGAAIMRTSQRNGVRSFGLVFILVCVAGSIFTAVGWVRSSRQRMLPDRAKLQ